MPQQEGRYIPTVPSGCIASSTVCPGAFYHPLNTYVDIPGTMADIPIAIPMRGMNYIRDTLSDGDEGTNTGPPMPRAERERIVIRTSIIGIITNLALAGLKGMIGILSNSVAITADAINNLTDALSSIVTIVGTKLAGMQPDKKHPLGYGRIEYLTTLIISAIILGAGVSAIFDSVEKIIQPEVADYSTITLVIIGAAVFVKIILGTYYKKVGRRVNSGALIASGKDALYDALLSSSVFLSAVIFIIWNISLEAYVGILIGAFIIKSGIGIMKDTLDDLLGKRADRELVDSIKETICKEPEVSAAYDLVLHSYGPDRFIGSVHVEVPSHMTAAEIDRLERKISDSVFANHGIMMAAVGIYTKDDRDEELLVAVTRIVMSHEGVVQIHGFNLDRENNILSLDIVMDFSMKDREMEFCKIRDEIAEAFPEYKLHIVMDADL